MTGNPHTPIYTRRSLAELVAKHDCEHPDHSNDCDCANGLISMLRIYFAPTEPIITDEPAPYMPPDAQSQESREVSNERKPWLKRRQGETKAEHDYRTSHSCYNCGTIIVDRTALNKHEDRCSQQGRRAQ